MGVESAPVSANQKFTLVPFMNHPFTSWVIGFFDAGIPLYPCGRKVIDRSQLDYEIAR